jgi:plasmid rolling circle replication initiator protein Rep
MQTVACTAIVAGIGGGVNPAAETDEPSAVEPDETAGEPQYVGECSPRDKPWDMHRADADDVARIYSADREFESLAGRVSMCSYTLGFAWAADTADPLALTLKLRRARFCRVRHCPICQWRRTLMWLARFLGALPKVFEKHPTARFLFLTLTLKNVPIGQLRITLAWMSKAWQRLVQRRQFGVVLGWIRTTELTRADDGGAHPHFHVLLLVPSNYFTKNYVRQARWTQMWREALRADYDPIIDVRAVKGDVVRAARETLKYSVKPATMKAYPEWFKEMTRQLRKLRFIASGGLLKDVLRPDEERDEDLLLLRNQEDSDEPPSVFFDWKCREKRYKRNWLPR